MQIRIHAIWRGSSEPMKSEQLKRLCWSYTLRNLREQDAAVVWTSIIKMGEQHRCMFCFWSIQEQQANYGGSGDCQAQSRFAQKSYVLKPTVPQTQFVFRFSVPGPSSPNKTLRRWEQMKESRAITVANVTSPAHMPPGMARSEAGGRKKPPQSSAKWSLCHLLPE